ncbi:MAG: RDD family protein [Propionibacteriaceae bacterium]
MSDIPVGSPPVPPGRHAAPGGWYPDPLDQGRERYWDGWQWSRTTREVELPQGRQQPGAAPYGQPYGGGYPTQLPPGQEQPYGQPPTGATGQPPQNPYQPGQYQQDPNQQGQYPQAPSAQGQYPQYPNGQYPQGQYAQPAYGSGTPGIAAARTADGVRLAGWWWRVLAVLIDWIIVSVIAAIPSIPIYRRLFDALAVVFAEAMEAARTGRPGPVPTADSLISRSDQLLLTLITVGVAFVFHVVFLRWKAATPGKLITGLRVVPVDQGRNREPLSWNAVLTRTAVWVLPNAYSLLLLVKVLDSLFPLWHPKRQALHDMAARTQVVRPEE